MRTVDEPTILPEATCAACKAAPWTRWCRGCNLVFCDAHAERKRHACKVDVVCLRPTNASEQDTSTCRDSAPPSNQNGSGVSVQMPMQLEIFTTPPEPPPAEKP